MRIRSYVKNKHRILLLSNILITFQLNESFQNSPITLLLFRHSVDKNRDVLWLKQNDFCLRHFLHRYIHIIKRVSIFYHVYRYINIGRINDSSTENRLINTNCVSRNWHRYRNQPICIDTAIMLYRYILKYDFTPGFHS